MLAEVFTDRPMKWSYVDEPRSGDHMCYYSDLRKTQAHYPAWSVTVSLEHIIEEIAVADHSR